MGAKKSTKTGSNNQSKKPRQKRQQQQAAKTPGAEQSGTSKFKRLSPKQRAQQQHIEERRTLVSQFNLSGASLRQIASLVTEKGYPCSHETVREDLEAIFEEEKKLQFDDVETLRIIGNRQLKAVMLAFWSPVMKGKSNEAWLWLALFSKWCDLNGVDKPKQVEVSGKDGGAVEVKLFGGINLEDV